MTVSDKVVFHCNGRRGTDCRVVRGEGPTMVPKSHKFPDLPPLDWASLIGTVGGEFS